MEKSTERKPRFRRQPLACKRATNVNTTGMSHEVAPKFSPSILHALDRVLGKR